MKSLTHLYRIGRGPSSSHSIGPSRAAAIFKSDFSEADSFKAVLYESLAKTGKGHLTDKVIKEAFAPVPCEVIFNTAVCEGLEHPCALDFYAYKKGVEIGQNRVYSIGGGAIRFVGREYKEPEDVYPHNSFAEIKDYCKSKNIRLWQYAEEMEGKQIWSHMEEIWNAMKSAVESGLKTEGVLAGGLGVQRKASILFNQYNPDEDPNTRENRTVCSYAFAVAEENASAGTVVTAPTCGSCGIVPAVMYYVQQKYALPDKIIWQGLLTAGIIGNLIKTNASISGAECGCQAEIGTACCMAAAALCEVRGKSLEQIECAAEISMEHMLGLTCDPINGLVQIPCIERNAVAAMRAINAMSLANFLTETSKVSFDTVVKTMYETGKDLNCGYRETAELGLAKYYSAHKDSL